jgi:hypothetical protein
LKQTDVSKVRTASIIRAMIKAVHTSEMSLYFGGFQKNVVRHRNIKSKVKQFHNIPMEAQEGEDV